MQQQCKDYGKACCPFMQSVYNYYYELILKHTRGRYYYFVAKANVLPFCAMERLQVVLLSGSNFGGSTLHSIFQDLRSFKRQVLDLKHYIL